MKKIYFSIFAFAFCLSASAQVLNESANWPNAAWTISGDYSTDPLAFEADPTLTANFAFDDDDAGTGHEDNIAAESPVVDLSAAFNAGEIYISVNVQYGYRYLADDVLRFEYWDADASVWTPFGGTVPGNNTVINNNYCTITKTAYITNVLNIANFTPSMRMGFRYRISYDDKIDAPDFNYGFCFDSPTIVSAASGPAATCNAALTTPTPGTTNAALTGVLNWTAATGVVSGYYLTVGTTSGGNDVLDGFDVGNVLTYDIPGTLLPSTQYFVTITTYNGFNTGTGCTEFTFTTLTPPTPPANDNFSAALAIACGQTYNGNTTLATLDEDNAPDGFGADLDAPNVWFTYTGTGTPEAITLNLCGSAYDTSVLVYTGESGNLSLVAANDDAGTASCPANGTRSYVTFNSDGVTTYYITVEGWNFATTGAFTMVVSCAEITPPAVDNQNCDTALALEVDFSTFTSDNSFGDVSPTQTSCDLFGSIQDVWFTFVAPASGLVDIQVTRGSMLSGNFTVYSGECGTLTEITSACNADFVTESRTEQMTGLVADTTYFLQVWSGAGDQGTFNVQLRDASLAVDPFEATSFKAYPNPVKTDLNLSLGQNISNVAVFNVLGQQVAAKTINATTGNVDMSNLSAGTYIVKVTADNATKTIKVIKE